MKTKEYWIEKLGLIEHPEGGYYKETYRSLLEVNLNSIDKEWNGKRNLATGIYFLLERNNFSAFHRIKSDELWHFYGGDPITIHMINLKGEHVSQDVGNDLDKGEVLQYLVPANTWFASEVKDNRDYALVGCTVSFGFDFDDFEMADRSLISEYPEHEKVLRRLIKE
ncbi:MAG: cupin domain-containing protein [Flavobacteriales bacterium]|nr:cupin domain-containing protein [Flavobacteriales bacterium]